MMTWSYRKKSKMKKNLTFAAIAILM